MKGEEEFKKKFKDEEEFKKKFEEFYPGAKLVPSTEERKRLKIISCGNPSCSAKIRIPENNNKYFRCPKCKFKHNIDGSLMSKSNLENEQGLTIYQRFRKHFDNGDINISTTSFILNKIFFDDAYSEFKHIVKKELMENKQKFIVRACLESEIALDSCWKHELIGLRPTEEQTPFLSKQHKDWRILIK